MESRQVSVSRRTLKITALCLCSFLALATTARPQATFTTFDAPGAGTTMPEGTVGMSINGEGDITGVFIDASFVAHGFLLPANGNGSIISFDAPFAGTSAGQGTFPIRINDSGVIVGTYFDANYIDHGFIRAADGTMDTFEVPSATLAMDRGTYPDGIDTAGDVSGFWKDSNGTRHGFVRMAANFAVITFDVSGAGTGATQGTVPINMNASGVITGVYIDSNGVDHGFTRATNGAITTFDCPGAETTVGTSKDLPIYGTLPTSINATGDVTGLYSDTSGVVHGFELAPNGTFTYPIDAPGAGTGTVLGGKLPAGTYPFSINTAGAIAGAYIDASGVIHSFVLSPNGTFTSPLDDPNAGAAGTGLIPGTGALSMNDSGVLTGGYFDASGVVHGFELTLTPTPTPTFSVPAGTYTSAQSVTISDATAGATIYYTTDGTIPTSASAQYTAAVSISSTETLQAVALAPGYSASAVASATYTIGGSAPVAGLSAASLTFASQDTGTTSAAQTVTVSNTGTANLIFTAISITGTGAGNFAIVPTGTTCSSSTPVAAGSNCAISVSFTPSATGTLSAALSLADNATGSPQTVALSGIGAAPGASLSASSLTFASQTVGTTSAAQIITVANSGSANLTFAAGAVTISGANAADFAVASDACSGTSIAPGGTCVVGVTFKPSINGSEAATLNFADNALGSPQIVSLSGTGATPTFTVTASSGSSTTATVSPGGTATYSLSLAPVSGFNQPITFTCTGAPSGAHCSVSPNPLTLNGTSATRVTVSVTTTAPSLAPPLGPEGPAPWKHEPEPLAIGLLALAMLAIMAWAVRRRWMPALSDRTSMRLRRAMWVAIMLGFASFAACGGGSNNNNSNPGTPAGTYTLTVTGTSGTLSNSINFVLTVQ